MEKVFGKLHQLFTNRCEQHSLLLLGEDSLRYDFFIALTEIKNIKPHEILLEFPIHENSFILRNNLKSLRKEKPLMDLVVDNNDLRISVEFGLFKQNSNDKGTINKTARTVKMINDMIRLGLDSYNTKRNSYFICVADYKIIGHQLKSKILDPFPSQYYSINKHFLEEQKKTRTADFDERFIQKFIEMKASITSELIYNQNIEADKLKGLTKLLVWEVKIN